VKEIDSNDLSKIMDEMPDGYSVILASKEGKMMVFQYPPDKLKELIEKIGAMMVYGMQSRPGVRYFIHHVEHTYFPPDTPKNDEYVFGMMKWEDMIWIFLVVPLDFEEKVRDSADKAGLVVKQGVATMISSDGIKSFPVEGDTIFSVENKRGSEVYGGPGAEQDLYVEETMRIRKEFQNQKR